MFYDGVGPIPTPLVGYNLSACTEPASTIPANEDYFVQDITVCGLTYAIGQTFASRAGLLTLLNSVLVPSFGLNGSFSIEPDGDLIYETQEGCLGTNCVNLEDPDTRLTEAGDVRLTEAGSPRLIE